jgi:hypothetical protein
LIHNKKKAGIPKDPGKFNREASRLGDVGVVKINLLSFSRLCAWNHTKRINSLQYKIDIITNAPSSPEEFLHIRHAFFA